MDKIRLAACHLHALYSEGQNSVLQGSLGAKTTPMVGPHAEVGLRPQLSPRGRATKEKKLKSLLEASCVTMY